MNLLSHQSLLMAASSGGGDPYFANVSSLLHFDGPNGSTTFTDVISSHVWTPHNGSQISTAVTLVAGQVGAFSGASSCYISTPYSAAYDFGTGDFTIEFTAMFSAIGTTNQIIVCRQLDSPVGIALQIRSSTAKKPEMVFRDSAGNNVTTFTGVTVMAANVKYAWGLRRIGGIVELYLNNVLEATGSFPHVLSDSSNIHGLIIGAADGSNPGIANMFSGWIDEFRVTKGVARDLTIPQVGPFPDHA